MVPNSHLGKIIIKTAIAGRYNQAAIWGGGGGGGKGYLGVSECIKEDGTKLTSGQDYYKDCNRW